MAAFAITGIQRSRLKNYRPTYYSDLPPIYEDPASLLRNGSRGSDEYVHCPRHYHDVTGRRNYSYAHDYEDINTAAMDMCSQTNAKSCSSQSTTEFLNGIMKKSQRFNANPSRYKSKGNIRSNERVVPTGSMLNGIMHNRMKSSSLRSNNRVTFCEDVDNNNEPGKPSLAMSNEDPSAKLKVVDELDEIDKIKNDIKRRTANGVLLTANSKVDSYFCEHVNSINTEQHEDVSNNALPVLNDLDKPLDMHDREINKITQPTREERNSLSSLYQVNGVYTGTPTDYGVVKDDQGFAMNRWPKLDPEPPKGRYLLCPAERKMRRRCFMFGFVILVLLIIFLLTGIIEGWMYGKTGTGFGGSDRTLLTTLRKDIRNSTMAEETI